LQSAGAFPLPPNTVVEGRVDNAEALTQTLVRALQRLRTINMNFSP